MANIVGEDILLNRLNGFSVIRSEQQLLAVVIATTVTLVVVQCTQNNKRRANSCMADAIWRLPTETQLGTIIIMKIIFGM